MIGFKNVWANMAALAVTIATVTFLYILLDKEKLSYVLGVTLLVCTVATITVVINKDKEEVKKDIKERATHTELTMVETTLNRRIDDMVEEDRIRHEQIFRTSNQTNKIVQMIFIKMGGKIDPEELNEMNSDLTEHHDYRNKK